MHSLLSQNTISLVILNGMVPSEREAEMIEAEIQSISGIHSIESQLQINNQFD